MSAIPNQTLLDISQLIRYWSLVMTTQAGSGHPTSALSMADILAVLMFSGQYHYDIQNPKAPNNDRLILSKGHASPALYAALSIAGALSADELLTLRQFESTLEGHPSLRNPYIDAATGSLGQGLSIGVGMALNAKLCRLSYKTFVILGDSEMAEGSNWEAIESASKYSLENLIAIVDVNRLGQRGETMVGHHMDTYRQRWQAFGWRVYEVDGHSISELDSVFESVRSSIQPTVILAKTYKGKGVSFLENQEGWHGKALSQEELKKALDELGEVNISLKVSLTLPTSEALVTDVSEQSTTEYPQYTQGELRSLREALGKGLEILTQYYQDIVVLDAEVNNSTYVRHNDSNRFIQMYIAEQNMVGVATGLSLRGFKPIIGTFAAFLTRAYDQIRMAQYNRFHGIIIGTHCGVSIGADGFSQMSLEDIGFFRAIDASVILYPSDAVSTIKLLEQAYLAPSMAYLRVTRENLPIIYHNDHVFVVGGSSVLRRSEVDSITLIGAGITVHTCLKASKLLQEQGVYARVIDVYSVKPLDIATLSQALSETGHMIVVEDHRQEGGISEAIRSGLGIYEGNIYSLAVGGIPRSGTPEELVRWANIDEHAILELVKTII